MLWLFLIHKLNAANVSLLCQCSCSSQQSLQVVDSCGFCTRDHCQSIYTDCPSGVTLSCFQRGSYKDESIVLSFVILLILLLCLAFLRPYLKAVFKTDRDPFTTAYEVLDDEGMKM
jgi:hypothetical protein